MYSSPNLPTITLDATLADLYRTDDAAKPVTQVMCPVNSAVQLSANIPRNTKYLYQDSAFNEPAGESLGANGLNASSSRAETERELAIKYIALVPQRDGFLSGNSTVILFDVNESPEERAHAKRETERTFSVLSEKQRPNIIFCSGPTGPLVRNQGRIACKLVHDLLEEGCCNNFLVPPETLYFINTKEALANSGLPTPKCDIVEVDGCGGDDAHLCCAICRRGDSAAEQHRHLIPPTCTGPRGRWLVENTSKILQALSTYPLPFVCKNQQAYGGAGTYIIQTETDRRELLRVLQSGVLHRLLSSITEMNKHLRPATILLSAFVDKLVGNYGVCFFVRDGDGDPLFLAVTEQILLEGRYWLGSTIDYDRQETLREKFGALVKDMASWLQKYRYIGPVGVDVLETAADLSGEDLPVKKNRENGNGLSNFHVVDLNARTSGQLCLPLFRTHFTTRGLNNASSFFIRVSKTRDAFIKAFKEEFEAGRICILSWYEDPGSDTSVGNVIIGAEDLTKLEKDMQRIRAVSEEVTF
jgi:hypothetical protein